MTTHFRGRLWALALVGLLVNSTAAVHAEDESTEGFLRITDGKSASQGTLFRSVRNPVHQSRHEVTAFGSQAEGAPAPLPQAGSATEVSSSQAATSEAASGACATSACGNGACNGGSCGCGTCGCGEGHSCGSSDCKSGHCLGSCLGRKCDGENCHGGCDNCDGSDGCGCRAVGYVGGCLNCLGRDDHCCADCDNSGRCGNCRVGNCLGDTLNSLCCQGCCKHSPDHGWGRPIKQPIYRTPVTYRHYWPQTWYGANGTGYGSGAPTFPMVYMPTDTTQLGFYYQRVPTWTPNPAMIPPAPWPAHWHKRECINNTFGYYEAVDAEYNGSGSGCTTCSGSARE